MSKSLSGGNWKIPHRGNAQGKGQRHRFGKINLKLWATTTESAGR